MLQKSLLNCNEMETEMEWKCFELESSVFGGVHKGIFKLKIINRITQFSGIA